MKHFSGRQASNRAGRRAVMMALSGNVATATTRARTAITASLPNTSASAAFACALHCSCVSYSSQTSKALASTKARARAATTAAALVPGAAKQVPSAATVGAKPIRSRNHSRSTGPSSAREKKANVAVTETAAPQQEQREPQQEGQTSSSTRRRRRTSTTSEQAQAADNDEGDYPRHIQPMRSRRATEQPRKRRNARQKAALLLRTHEELAKGAGASGASFPCRLATTAATERPTGSPKSTEEGRQGTFSAGRGPSRRPEASVMSTRSAPQKAEAASLTTDQLLSRVELTSFVERVVARVRDWAASLKEWAHRSTDPTLREWERQLLLSLRKDSFADCSAVQYAMQQRYEDQFGSSSSDVAFLNLYARVLVNNAVFCLLNFVTYRATELLAEAVNVAQRAYTLQREQEQQQQQGRRTEGEEMNMASRGKNRSRSRRRTTPSAPAAAKKSTAGGASSSLSSSAVSDTTTTAAAATAVAAVKRVNDPDSHLLFLRVLLANAYASDQQYWKAAEQYQLVMSALERSPLFSADQLTPGVASPRALNRIFVEEDARRFYENPARVHHAVAQGMAQLLLLQSQGAAAAHAVPVMHAQLAMARLHRHAGRHAESQSFYESYLDGAAVHMEGEDVAGVMLELGRLLLYKRRDKDAALVYLEAGSSMLLDDAQELLTQQQQQQQQQQQEQREVVTTSAAAAMEGELGKAAVRIAAGNTAQRAASGLVDTAMAFHAQGKTGKAIGLLEGSLQLLDTANLRLVGGWVRMRYADMLTTVSLVDRALDEYTRAMTVLRGEGGEVVDQLGPGGRLVRLSAAEVEAHLAFCLQTYVGDHKRAMKHYRHVVQGSYKASPLVKSAQAKLSKRARRQRAAAAAATASTSDAGDTAHHAGTCSRGGGGSSSSSVGSAPLSSDGLALKPDTLHWVLSNYVACCERVEAFTEAVGVQSRLIEIEGALGGNVVDSYLKLIDLQQKSGEIGKALALCFYVFHLPDAMMPPHMRLEVADHFASSCHQLGNNRMGAVLMQAVQHVRGVHDADALVHYATCLNALDPADRLQLDGMMDIEASIQSIGRVFRRAASIVVSDVVMDREEEKSAMRSSNGTSSDTTPISAAANDDAGASAPSWTQERVARVLSGLIVLSRGAFFFHQNRFMKEAADLYAYALEQVDHIMALMPVYTDTLQQEMGVLLVNYATLKASEDPKMAATLYERAAAVCPSSVEVAEVVADFFVQSGDYAKGLVYMKRVLRANPTAAAELHLRLAWLGARLAWETLSYGQRMEVMEHLLRGLGVSAERIAAACAMATQRQLSSDDTKVVMSLADFSQLLMDGVATTNSEDAVCLATYIVQTRFEEPKLLNRMYRRAVLRFPRNATILMNYATLCMFSGHHVLARKFNAKAYAASSGDLNCTMCYAHYLRRSYEDRQIGCSESLFRHFLDAHPNSAQMHAAFANFMAGAMPTPFKTEEHFKRALELAPRSEDAVLQYGQFIWACTDSKIVYTNDEVRRLVFDRAEKLFKDAVAINPSSFTACHQLGTFYANRHNRFEDAMAMLYRAHKLQPGNVEVLRHILNTLHEECVRVQREEELQQSGTVKASPRLRSLTAATHDMFDNVVSREPNDRATLERYARFAVETLRDSRLAASLYSRIQELSRK